MAEIKANTIIVAKIGDVIKAGFILETGLDLSDYGPPRFTGNIISMVNDKGVKIEIEAQFVVKGIGKQYPDNSGKA